MPNTVRGLRNLSIATGARPVRAMHATGMVLLVLTAAPDDARAQPAPPAVSAPSASAAAAATPGRALSLLDAVRTTLRTHPAIQTAEAVLRQSRALLKVAQGPFDPLVIASASQNHSASPVIPAAAIQQGEGSLFTDTTALNVGASMNTTVGTSITPSIGLSRVDTRANIPITTQGFVAVPAQFSTVGLSVTQALLRGAGTVGAASAVAAAKLAGDAGRSNVDGTAQAQVYLAVVAYFQVVAAEENLALLQEAQTAARKVVDDTRALVEGQQRPRSDLPGLEGNLANRSRDVIEAEDDRIQAVQTLALAMGLGAEGVPDFRTTDSFPDPSTPTPDRDAIVRFGLRDRGDLAAARETAASAAALVRGAEHNTLPTLDLNLSLGYAGALQQDGVGPFFGALGANIPGVNGGVGLSLALPVRNLAQEGDRDLKRSQLDQATIAERDLERQLPIGAASALQDLALSRSALSSAAEAVKQFGQAVADQRDKLHEGVGTSIDLVLTEELLITAEENRTAARLRCASALARVLFEMGALPASDGAPVAALRRMLRFEGHGAP